MSKMEIIIKKLSNPIACISVLAISLILAIVYSVMINMESGLQKSVQEMPIEVSKVEETGEIEVATIDVEAQKEQQQTQLEADVVELLNPQQELVEKAQQFFNARYNYEGTPSANKDRIISEVEDIITTTEYNRLQTELQTSGAGNMGVRVPKSQKCEIIGIFTDYKKPSEYNLDSPVPVEINVYVSALMNDSSEVLYNVAFIEKDSVWYIDDVEFRSNRGV